MRIQRLLEASPIQFLSPSEGAKGKSWDVVLIEAGWSKNKGPSGLPRYYPAAVIREAVAKGIFENMPVMAYRYAKPVLGDHYDHVSDQARPMAVGNRLVENKIGFYSNTRYGAFERPDGSKGEGALATMNVYEGASGLRENMVDAWNRGRYNEYGLSIDADGEARIGAIEGRRAEIAVAISAGLSTDVVSAPAAGGSLLRLVASREGDGNVDELLKLMQQKRARWVPSMSGAEGKTPADALRHFAESVKAASDEAIKAESGGPKLREAGEDAVVAKKLLMLLEDQKVDEALALLRQMLGEMEVPVAEAKEKPAVPAAPVPPPPGAPMKESQVNEETKQMLAEMRAEGAKLAAERQKIEDLSKSIQLREAITMVESVLVGSGLPDSAKSRVRERLDGKLGLTAETVQKCVTQEKTYIASLQESLGLVPANGQGGTGFVQPTVAFSKEKGEKLQDAMDGMISGEPKNGHMFRSIQESWKAFGNGFSTPDETAETIFRAMSLAFPRNKSGISRTPKDGDFDMSPLATHHNYLRESWNRLPASFRESVKTTDWPIAFGDALNRRFEKAYNEDPKNDWKKIATIETLNDWTNPHRIMRHGAVGELPIVTQESPYQELSPATPTEQYETLTPEKRGGFFVLTMEDVMADHLKKIRDIPRMLARSAVRTIHTKVWGLIESNTTIQSNALISTANANILASAGTMSYANVVLMRTILRKQTEGGSSAKLGLTPKYLVSSVDKADLARELCESDRKNTSAEDSTVKNILNADRMESLATLGLGLGVVSANTPYYYYLLADKNDCEFLAVGFPGGRDRPDIFVQGEGQQTIGDVFESDSVRFKTRLVVGACLVDWRPIVGSLAAS